jgi:hypothetical protein
MYEVLPDPMRRGSASVAGSYVSTLQEDHIDLTATRLLLIIGRDSNQSVRFSERDHALLVIECSDVVTAIASRPGREKELVIVGK